ncbi:MAG: hypothetical protein V4472_24895 [Pseudomonadota bacterium]
MSALLAWIIGLSCFAAYMALATVVGLGLYATMDRRYRWHLANEHNSHCYCSRPDLEFGAAFCGMGWPLSVWWLLGIVVVFRRQQALFARAEMDKERNQLMKEARRELDQL